MTIKSAEDLSERTTFPELMKGKLFVGNLFDFGKDPLLFMKDAVAMGLDIVDFKVPGERVSIVTSAELCHKILVKHAKDFRKADRDVGVMAHVLGKGLVTNNDYASHKAQRKLVQPSFHFRKIESYAQTMIDYTYSYTQNWPQNQKRDVNDDMFRLTLYIVSKTLFNSDVDTMQAEADYIGKAMHSLQVIMNKGFQSMFVLPKWMPMPGHKKLAEAKHKLRQAILKMIKARTNPDGSFNSAEDLLSMLIEARYDDGSKMSEDQLLDELVTLLSAGHETTSNTLSWTLYLIAKNPSVQKRLQQEVNTVVGKGKLCFEDLSDLSYTEQVIKEAMRLFPPAWTLNTRQANCDIHVGGYFFPKDKHVFISPYANHINPRYFTDPERFDPERFTEHNESKLPRYAYMPFGGGNRVCIGNSFAMMENKILLAIMCQGFRFETSEKTRICPQPHVTLSNKDGMHLNVYPR
jgi:cytochrome P450